MQLDEKLERVREAAEKLRSEQWAASPSHKCGYVIERNAQLHDENISLIYRVRAAGATINKLSRRIGSQRRALANLRPLILTDEGMREAAREASHVLTQHDRDKGRGDDLFREVYEVIMASFAKHRGRG